MIGKVAGAPAGVRKYSICQARVRPAQVDFGTRLSGLIPRLPGLRSRSFWCNHSRAATLYPVHNHATTRRQREVRDPRRTSTMTSSIRAGIDRG